MNRDQHSAGGTAPLRDALHSRAEQLNDAPVTLDDIRGRAGSIRRRRRLAAGAAALAVVAVLTPVGIATLGGDAPTPLPADTPGQVEPSTPEGGADGATDGNGEDTPVTDTEGVGVLRRDTITRPDGGSFTPDVVGQITSFSRVGDGRWAVEAADYSTDITQVAVYVVDDEGTQLATYDSSDGFGLLPSHAHDAVAWIDREGGVQVLQAGSRLPAAVGDVGPTDDFTGHQLLDVRGDCAEPAGCRALVETYGRDGTSNAWLSVDGSEPFLAGVFEQIHDVSPDGRLVSGMTSYDEFGQEYCYGMYDTEAQTMLWERCDAGSFTFSADGQRVLALDPYLDGPNHGLNVILDPQDGTEIARHEAPLFDEQWETADSWVSVDGENGTSGRFTVVRHTIGAEDEVLARGAGSEPVDAPFRLEAR